MKCIGDFGKDSIDCQQNYTLGQKGPIKEKALYSLVHIVTSQVKHGGMFNSFFLKFLIYLHALFMITSENFKYLPVLIF